ncbi:unnamed protein product, partial [Polarella glacialis]
MSSFEPSGLHAAATIKAQRALKEGAAENGEECFIDEVQWRADVIDLCRVMECAKKLWLILEHSNEAMIRTALEIMVCRVAKKTLWWQDFWYSVEEKREYFKSLVGQKLAIAIANAKRSKVDLSALQGSGEEDPRLAVLRKQLEESEAALKAARAAQAAAENDARNMREAAEEAAKRIADLEKSIETYRSQAKENAAAANTPAPKDDSEELRRLKAQLSERDKQVADLEQQLKDLTNEIKRRDSLPKEGNDKDSNAELQMAQRRIEDLEKQLKQARADLAAEKKKPPQGPTEKAEKPSKGASEKEKALSEQLEEEQRLREALEGELKNAQDELERLRLELEASKKLAKELQANLDRVLALQSGTGGPEVPVEAAPAEVPVTGMTQAEMDELARLCLVEADVEKLKAKLQKKNDQIKSLQEENNELNEEQMRLLKLLKQVREQLRLVMELAEKKGLGDVIKNLFEEAGLAETMEKAYTCFDRLYDDALRRQNKQRRLEWFKLGGVGEPPADFQGKNPYAPSKRANSPASPKGGEGSPGGTLRYGGGTTCQNCGFPIREAFAHPGTRTAPDYSAESNASTSAPGSPAPPMVRQGTTTMAGMGSAGGSHAGISPAGVVVAIVGAGRARRRLPSNHQMGGPHARSPSPQTAHALDMRIEVTKLGGGGLAAIASTILVEDPWGDAPEPYGLGAAITRPGTTQSVASASQPGGLMSRPMTTASPGPF